MTPINYQDWDGKTFPALVLNMPNDEYHSHPGSVSSSGLRRIMQSPAHFMHAPKRAPSRAMEIGTAIHTALLEPERFASEYMLLRDVTDRRTSAYKEAVKAYGTERVLTGPEADEVIGMQESVMANEAARHYLSAPGYREASLFVQHPGTGTVVRVRYDILYEDACALDLKSTRDARPDAFSKSVEAYGYHFQAALYMDAWEWATGEQMPFFVFCVVEREMPHGVKLYELDCTAIDEGRRMYEQALALYVQCQQSGEWPCYPCDHVELLSLPAWRVAQIENEIQEEII